MRSARSKAVIQCLDILLLVTLADYCAGAFRKLDTPWYSLPRVAARLEALAHWQAWIPTGTVNDCERN